MFADLPVVRRQLADPGRITPRSREAADHSLHFLIAVTLIDGTFGLAQFDGERWNDPKVRALMARLEMTTDADLADTCWRLPTLARCMPRGGDGRRYDVEILAPPGFSPHGPEAPSRVGKIRAHHGGSPHAPAARERIIETVMGLDAAASCASLVQALAPRAAAVTGLS